MKRNDENIKFLSFIIQLEVKRKSLKLKENKSKYLQGLQEQLEISERISSWIVLGWIPAKFAEETEDE